MDFFNNLKKTVSDKSKDAVNKAKEIAEVTSLNSKINAQENLIEKHYNELGRYMYENRENPDNSVITERNQMIDAAFEEITRLQGEIRRVKGVKVCPGCGAEVSSTAAFCATCGTAMPKEEPVAAEVVEAAEVVAEETNAAE